MKLVVFNSNDYEENAYLLYDNKEAYIIDPGQNSSAIFDFLSGLNVKLKSIFITHGHLDHIYDISKINEKYNDIEIYIHELDYDFLFDNNLNLSKNGEISISKSMNIKRVNDGDRAYGFEFYHTPGHTRGSMVIKHDDMLFTGDTLFKGTIGRTDFPSGSIIKMKGSLEKIATKFSRSIRIYPGHFESTTLKEELENNAYIQRVMKGK